MNIQVIESKDFDDNVQRFYAYLIYNMIEETECDDEIKALIFEEIKKQLLSCQ